MNLSELQHNLTQLQVLVFTLPNQSEIPNHFHITEVGYVQKNFIDCGGTIRKDAYVSLQLWEGNDTEHRLQAEKLLKIIDKSISELRIPDEVVRVEYQGNTLGIYDLAFNNGVFELLPVYTDCLAKESCRVPAKKTKVQLKDLSASVNSCCGTNDVCC